MGRLIFTLPMILTFALFRSSSLGSYDHLLDQLFGGTEPPAGPTQDLALF